MAEQQATSSAVAEPVEDHSDDPVCVGQWCCGCSRHPLGKPWGSNADEWDRHFTEVAHPAQKEAGERG